MGTVEIGRDQDHQPIIVKYDDDVSFRDFTGWDMKQHPEIIIDGKTVYASCFSNEKPDAEIFPQAMSGATFVKCNLDNIKLPPNNTVVQCSERRFKVQNDLRDWELDGNNIPIRVINEKYWAYNGYSVDPADIPPQPIGSLDEIPTAASEVGPG